MAYFTVIWQIDQPEYTYTVVSLPKFVGPASLSPSDWVALAVEADNLANDLDVDFDPSEPYSLQGVVRGMLDFIC